MTIRVRAKDGSIRTFPDGTSEPVIRMAMLAYDNSDRWGSMDGHVAKAAGQDTEVEEDVDGGWPDEPAASSGLAQAIGAVATPEELETLKTHPQFGAMLADAGSPQSPARKMAQIGRSSARTGPLGLGGRSSGENAPQFQTAAYDARDTKQSPQRRSAGVQLREAVEDELEGIGRGF